MMPLDKPGHRWLSRGAEVLAEEVAAAPEAIHCDLLVVGSGYGGAVAAARFAGARPAAGGNALRVVVLERGNEFLPGEFPATFAELPGQVRFSRQDGRPARGRRDGLFDVRLGDDVHVLLGSGLGGGSLINAAVMEEPSADAFEAGWPRAIDAASLRDGYRAAREMLAPERIPGKPPKLASLFATGKAIGATEVRKADIAVAFADGPSPVGVALLQCLQCGDCVSGCNHGAKKSLDVNYLALARMRGAELYCGGTVHLLRPHPQGGYEVHWYLTDPQKAPGERALRVLRAQRVILGAGSLGSTEILLRSRAAGLPVASAALGQRFSTNGDLIAVAQGQRDIAHPACSEGVPPKQREVGPTITGLARLPQPEGRPLVFEEFAIPAPLYRLLGEVIATTGALHGLLHTDGSLHRPNEQRTDPLAVDAAQLEHTPIYGMMGDDGAAGTMQFATDPLAPDGEPCDGQLAIVWKRVDQHPVFSAQMEALRLAHEGDGKLGGYVIPNPTWRLLPPSPWLDGLAAGTVTTVHPLGGCPMADRNDEGVVDDIGRVYAAGDDPTAHLPGLAVLDGAIVPVALGINPSLTIAALAERAVPRLAADPDWGLALATAPPAPLDPRPRRRDVTQPEPPRPTSFTLHERMTGTLAVDGRHYTATALIDFAPAEVGLWRKLPRKVDMARVDVTLDDTDTGERWRLNCSGRAEVLVRDHSTQLSRVLRALGPARRRLQRLAGAFRNGGSLLALAKLCSHLGEVRLIRYRWRIEQADSDMGTESPLPAGAVLQLTKRIEFTDDGNPWRQLSEGTLARIDGCHVELGRMSADLSYFAEQAVALLQLREQQDAPNALGDLVELGLWILRVSLNIHLLNFLPPDDAFDKSDERLPGAVDGIKPDTVPLPSRAAAPFERQLARYRPPRRAPGSRPVLLIHGFGASGSTFTHHSIGKPLVSTLLDAGREVWVLDLRTSIGLPANKHRRWTFDEVAAEDIPEAVAAVLEDDAADGRVDVVAHCIGAAMFSVAVLRQDTLHERIGCVALSQVGPLVAGSPMNRFRAYVASYLQQYLGVDLLDVRPENPDLGTLLADAVLATFPYPDGDGEAERLLTLPGFAAVRHRADAIFGQTMRLSNISDETLKSLDAIYGYASVTGLTQVGHYVGRQVLTDAGGENQNVAFETLARRFGFPLLLLHGRHNGVFDWRGSYRAIDLLRRVFDKATPAKPDELPDEGDLIIGAGSPRQLHVLGAYGHQDTLIGEHAHRDVFPRIVEFFASHATTQPNPPVAQAPLDAAWAWTGPTLGAVKRRPDGTLLDLRVALRATPGHASMLAVVLVPAARNGSGWRFEFEEMAALTRTREELATHSLMLTLRAAALPRFQGFAVLTVHTHLPVPLQPGSLVKAADKPPTLFDEPITVPADEVRSAVKIRLAQATADEADAAIVRLDPSWLAAVLPAGSPPGDALCLALASCQYPAGLFDRACASASDQRLAARVNGTVTGLRPQALLLLGDQVYVDDTAGLFSLPGAQGTERAYEANHRLDAYRRVTRALPTYPILDDHEVTDNWEPAPDDGSATAVQAYVQRQHKLVASTAAAPFHYRAVLGGLPLLVLDTRTTRQRRGLTATGAGIVPLAQAQIAPGIDYAMLLRIWEPGVPRLLVSPVALLPLERAAAFGAPAERIGIDDWGGFPASQRDLFAALCAAPHHPGAPLVVLSGDRHLSSVSSLWLDTPQGEVEIVSIVASGLYSPWPFANARADAFWLDGPLDTTIAGRRFTGRMQTPIAGGADGYAVVSLTRDHDVWTIEVELDLADATHCARRRLDGAMGGSWQVLT